MKKQRLEGIGKEIMRVIFKVLLEEVKNRGVSNIPIGHYALPKIFVFLNNKSIKTRLPVLAIANFYYCNIHVIATTESNWIVRVGKSSVI